MDKKPITVFFGSMTGNAEDLAERTVERLQEEGYEASLRNLDDYDAEELKTVERCIISISTWGEGDPPDECEDFCYQVIDGKVDNLSNLEYCVLALGDSSYDDFCGCGRKVDEAIQKAGGKPFMTRKELDVDFDDDFDEWIEELCKTLTAQPA